MKLQRRMVIETCNECGVYFGLTEDYREAKFDNGTEFQCPNGHILYYQENRESKINRLENMLAKEKAEKTMIEATTQS